MEREHHFLSSDALPTPGISLGALYLLAAVLGIPGIALLFSGEYQNYLIRDLMVSGIANSSSLRSWRLIGAAVTVLAFAGPCLLAAGLAIARFRRPARGASFLAGAAQWLLYGLTGAGILAAAVFFIRVVRYIVIHSSGPSGVMAIYSMLISEAVMAAITGFAFFLTRKFLNCCIDSGASIAYTAATGKADDRSIPGFAATGFLLLALAGLALAADRLFTMTIVVNIVKSYYKILVADHPGLWLEAGCLVCGSGANFMMFRYLRRYKKATEQMLYEARRMKK